MALQTDPIYVTKGSCIDFDILYRTEADEVDPITDDEFAVVAESSPATAFADAELTATDGPAGTLHFHLPAASVALLRMGNVNAFRIQRTFTDGCIELSPIIWVAVI